MFGRQYFKKIGIAFFFCLFISPICVAQRPVEYTRNLGAMPISCSIYKEQTSINGICVGDSMKKLLAAFGKPYHTSQSDHRIDLSYKGASIQLTAWDLDDNYIVTSITVDGRGDFSTADGVRVGMSETVLSKIYGTADGVSAERHKAPKLSEKDNEEYRKRFDKTIYAYNVNESVTMWFTVKNGMITSIKVRASE